MALTNNFLPSTSLVFGVRDFAPQIAQQRQADTNAIQNFAKFMGNVIDISKNSQIADEMNKEEPDYKKIDSLAASRVMAPDTSFSNWRWKQQMDANELARKEALQDTLREKENGLANAQFEIVNTLNTVRPTPGMDTAMKQSYLNKLADLRTMAQKNRLSTEEIDRKIALVENDGVDPNAPAPTRPVPPAPAGNNGQSPYGTNFTGTNAEQVTAEVNQLLEKAKVGKATQKEFAELKKKYGAGLADLIGNELYNKLNAAHAKRIDADRDAADYKAMKDDFKRRTGKDFDKADPYVQKKERERWKRRNKK